MDIIRHCRAKWMFMKQYFIFILLMTVIQLSFSQNLQPGFDKREYRDLMMLSAHSTADSTYYSPFEIPEPYKMIYQSDPLGLDNSWDLWSKGGRQVVISIRGTTANPASWLANFYAAMVPAKGSLQLEDDFTFNYTLSEDPKAFVHIGWLVSTAFLSREIVPAIEEQYNAGHRDFLIVGHSQGGAIAYLLTSFLHHLQKNGDLPTINLKTYCSAAPKPGNLYYAYAFEKQTQGGWAYNVINTSDWVPEMPISVQTLDDFNEINPFMHAKTIIKSQKFPKNLVLKHVYKKLDKPTRMALKNYQNYLGKKAYKIIRSQILEFDQPVYANSTHYVRTGNTIILTPTDDYFARFPNDTTKLFPHHFHAPYLYLLEELNTFK